MKANCSKSEARYLQRKIIEFGKSNFDSYPWRSTKNIYHAITAEVMLQRTNAEAVRPVYEDFVKKYKTPADFLADQQADPFKRLGLAWRTAEFKKLSKVLTEKAIARDYGSLLKLPGIGPYIAGAICSFHLKQRAVIIDSNVVRFYGRFFGFSTTAESRRKKSMVQLAEQLTPRIDHRSFNYAILDFTRQICKPQPLCSKCPLRRTCYFALTR